MTTLILYAMILTLIQAILPNLLGYLGGVYSRSYLFSARDEQLSSTHAGARARRAFLNLLESLPIFLTLAVLSIIEQKDLVFYGQIWLAARILYVPGYIIDIPYTRTIIWLVSLWSLLMMGLNIAS